MLSLRHPILGVTRLCAARGCSVNVTREQLRCASLTSSIGNGKRRSQSARNRLLDPGSNDFRQDRKGEERRFDLDYDGPAFGISNYDSKRYKKGQLLQHWQGRGSRAATKTERKRHWRDSYEDIGDSHEGTPVSGDYIAELEGHQGTHRHGRGSRGAAKEEKSYQKNTYEKSSASKARIAELEGQLGTLDSQMSQQRQRKPKFNIAEMTEVYQPLSRVKIVAPKMIKYHNPASEFVYGSSAVLAALRCRRRKLHVVYIYQPDGGFDYSRRLESRITVLKAIQKWALIANCEVQEVSGNWLQYLDKLSGGRPHNGVVLEASPLPQTPILQLRKVDSPSDTHFKAALAPMQQDEAEIHGSSEDIPRFFHTHNTLIFGSDESPRDRFPFVIVLENVHDPGNLGAIIRSAYYFGADAVALSRHCCSVTPVAIKASAGAAENLPILRVNSTAEFVKASRANGWKFYAADAPGSEPGFASKRRSNYNEAAEYPETVPLSSLSTKLKEAPCALVMGNEDAGVPPKVLKAVDSKVSIVSALNRSAAEDDAEVDSLNVSVAAALLCQAFLGNSSLVQRATPMGPALTVAEMVNERVTRERTAESDEERVF